MFQLVEHCDAPFIAALSFAILFYVEMSAAAFINTLNKFAYSWQNKDDFHFVQH